MTSLFSHVSIVAVTHSDRFVLLWWSVVGLNSCLPGINSMCIHWIEENPSSHGQLAFQKCWRLPASDDEMLGILASPSPLCATDIPLSLNCPSTKEWGFRIPTPWIHNVHSIIWKPVLKDFPKKSTRREVEIKATGRTRNWCVKIEIQSPGPNTSCLYIMLVV